MTNEATNHEVGRIYQPHSNRKSSAYAGLIVAGVLALATSPTVGAANDTESTLPGLLAGPTCSTPIETKLTEWDIENIDDFASGAVVVDDRSSSRHSKVWFVTRNGSTRVYRFTPGRGFRKDAAEAKSWDLGQNQTGGVRLRHSDDGRFVFINTNQQPVAGALVAVDTVENKRITWVDRPLSEQMSDVSVDTRGGAYNVFTAAPSYTDDDGSVDGPGGVVQRLRPLQPKLVGSTWVVPAEVTRWVVGGGAGSCLDTGAGAPCIPGVVVDRRHGHSIYVSEPDFVFKNSYGTITSVGAIGEIDPRPVKCSATDLSAKCVKVRHWPLPAGTTSPRQILVDDTGRLWGVMSSGTLFSLDVERSSNKGTITRHDPDALVEEDLFAVAPDGGTVGFTDTNNHKVSVLFPNRVKQTVYPVVKLVEAKTRYLDGTRVTVYPESHMVTPRTTTAMGFKYTKPGDGTYVETNVNTGFTSPTGSQVASEGPTGMSPDGVRKTGSFFYGVTLGELDGRSNRIGHLEEPIDPDKETEHRKDDDDYDDDGDYDDRDGDDDNDVDDDDDNDCIPDMMDKDHDNDGVENEYDSKSHRENKRTDRGSMGPGEAKGYDMESNSNSVLMIAVVEAADLTTPLSIEFVDPNGVVVLSTPPALGKAVATMTPALPGLYTVRVKNGGLKTTTYKTTLVGKTIYF
jgi:hypothetical protein